MTTLLTIIGVLLVALSGVPYIRALLRGQVRPKLVSWSIWTVIAVITTLASLQEGQLPSALVSMVGVITCGTIVLLGWRRGSRQVSKLDIVCMAGAVLGIAVFVGAKDPLLALGVSLAVDAIAFIPTFVHGWNEPEEESMPSFAYAAIGQLLTVGAALMAGAVVSGLMYPMYALVFNGVMVVILAIGKLSGQSDMAYEADEA